jgi:hypothetical protein
MTKPLGWCCGKRRGKTSPLQSNWPPGGVSLSIVTPGTTEIGVDQLNMVTACTAVAEICECGTTSSLNLADRSPCYSYVLCHKGIGPWIPVAFKRCARQSGGGGN